MPDYRETTINVLHGEKTAHVWTNNRATKTRLKLCGYKPAREQNGGCWYLVPASTIRIRKPLSSAALNARRANLAAGRT